MKDLLNYSIILVIEILVWYDSAFAIVLVMIALYLAMMVMILHRTISTHDSSSQ